MLIGIQITFDSTLVFIITRILDGLLLGLLQALTEYFFDSRWVMMVTFILLIFFLLLRPQGLIPEKSRAF